MLKCAKVHLSNKGFVFSNVEYSNKKIYIDVCKQIMYSN